MISYKIVMIDDNCEELMTFFTSNLKAGIIMAIQNDDTAMVKIAEASPMRGVPHLFLKRFLLKDYFESDLGNVIFRIENLGL